jgi:2-dehydro-3-deoxyphosphooctonate aldolase (KDO 8-P synthase)
MKEASVLSKILENRDWYYKASFDKANRTSLKGGRGLGLDESLELFKSVKEKHPSIKLTTDVHECWQVERLAPYIDCIQIPAFLCRQTDLLVECANNFSIVNVKKGQWLGPENACKSVDKIKNTNPDCEAWLTERGSNFGYNEMTVNFRHVPQFKENYDKVIFDVTHSTQCMNGFSAGGGDRNLAEKYLYASPIFGYDGVFAEVHPNPPAAVSDGNSQMYLDRLKGILRIHDSIRETVVGSPAVSHTLTDSHDKKN